jgi:hypothetical protein
VAGLKVLRIAKQTPQTNKTRRNNPTKNKTKTRKITTKTKQAQKSNDPSTSQKSLTNPHP